MSYNTRHTEEPARGRGGVAIESEVGWDRGGVSLHRRPAAGGRTIAEPSDCDGAPQGEPLGYGRWS